MRWEKSLTSNKNPGYRTDLCPGKYFALPLLFSALLLAGCASQKAVQTRANTGARLLPSGYHCRQCSLDFLSSAFAPPTHGLILAEGGFFIQSGSWWVVDNDTRIMSRISTIAEKDDQRRFRLRVQSRTDFPLSAMEVEKIQTTVDTIWALPGSLGTAMRYDVTWDLYLIDGESIRHELGLGTPTGQGHDLEELLQTIERAHRKGADPKPKN